MKCIDCRTETAHTAPCGLFICQACCDACYACDTPCLDRGPSVISGERIKWLQTPNCRECKGKMNASQYNNSQSPCYHCESAAAAIEAKQVEQRARRKAIPENTKAKIIALYSGGMSRTDISIEVGLKKHQIDGFIKRAKHKGLIPTRKAVSHETAETI